MSVWESQWHELCTYQFCHSLLQAQHNTHGCWLQLEEGHREEREEAEEKEKEEEEEEEWEKVEV